MNLQGHLDAVGLESKELAREAFLSYATVYRVRDGKPVSKLAVESILVVLSQKYGRKVAREEVEGLLFRDVPQA